MNIEDRIWDFIQKQEYYENTSDLLNKFFLENEDCEICRQEVVEKFYNILLSDSCSFFN